MCNWVTMLCSRGKKYIHKEIKKKKEEEAQGKAPGYSILFTSKLFISQISISNVIFLIGV